MHGSPASWLLGYWSTDRKGSTFPLEHPLRRHIVQPPGLLTSVRRPGGCFVVISVGFVDDEVFRRYAGFVVRELHSLSVLVG